MQLQIVNHLVELVCLVLVILCMLASLKKTGVLKQNSVLCKIIDFHDFYAVGLLILALVHGVLSGKAAAMMSGKLAWTVLLVMIVLAFVQKKSTSKFLKKAHVVLAIILCVGIVAHVIHAMIF